MSLQNSHQISEVKVLLKKGADGAGIANIELTGTSGIVDTYTITLTNGDKYTFTVTNGSSIANIAKTGTSGNVDTYTITLTNGDTYTFTVTNATGSSADGITYDNSDSGLTATNVQDAIDEIVSLITTLSNEKLNESVIAPVEASTTASQAYSVGDQFIYNGILYEATASIASGGTITIGTNCKASPTIVKQIKHGLFEVWVNSTPTSSFAGQNVDITQAMLDNDGLGINIDDIDAIEVDYRDTSGNALIVLRGSVGDTINGFYIAMGSDGRVRQFSRGCSTNKSTNQIRCAFGDCTLSLFNSYGSAPTNSTSNGSLIPERILFLIHNKN
jgi:hypothetical protein